MTVFVAFPDMVHRQVYAPPRGRSRSLPCPRRPLRHGRGRRSAIGVLDHYQLAVIVPSFPERANWWKNDDFIKLRMRVWRKYVVGTFAEAV